MNKILLLLLFIIPLSLFGQVESQFNGTLNVFSASRIGFTNTFTISGIFSSTTSSYTSTNSAIGDIVQVQSGNRFYWLHIYSIASNSGGVITGNVRDSSSTLTTFPTGKWSIFRPTPNLRLPLSPDGETNASRSATFNTLALRVDEIQTAVASATNCEQTFTKASHEFRKGTPVFWNGSTYIRPTADSLVPDFVVVDSLTANTFKVANCGTYTTSLANGLYWFTSASPGYSLTQDTTKVPLFQALNGKLILNPIVGFNLMSGSGGTADGNGIYSGSDSLSQENTYAVMASDGSQTFGLGYWPSFPSRDYDYETEYGLYVSPTNGEVTLSGGRNILSLYGNDALIGSSPTGKFEKAQTSWQGNNSKISSRVDLQGNNRNFIVLQDTTGLHLTDNITTGIGSGTYRFPLPSVSKPSATSGAISSLSWTAGTPSFLRSQHGVATGTTDGSGDLTVTFAAAMPDATYTALCQSEGSSNSYTWEVHTKTTSSFKIRVRDSNTKAVITATSVTFGYESKDY